MIAPAPRPDLDRAGAACRNASIELAELAEKIRGLRFRRERFDIRSGCGLAFTNLTLALNEIDNAAKLLAEASAWFYCDNPDVFWMDDNGELHYIEDEEEQYGN